MFPGMAVGEELLERQHQVLLVVSEKEVDTRAVEKVRGFLVETLPAVAWRGVRPDRAFHFAAGLVRAMGKARRIFKSFHPNAVLGMGGFSSAAPLFQARWSGIPSCIHESNAIPGKANRLAARFATKVAVGLELAGRCFPAQRTIWTGTPVRAALRQPGDRLAACKELGLEAGRPVVLVVGGSQGARGLNRLVLAAAEKMQLAMPQWLHLTGAGEEETIRKGYAELKADAKVMAFSSEMPLLYAAADLVVARSGASSLAEIAQLGLPSILTPYPHAADNHQLANARLFADAGAALLCEERTADPAWLGGEIAAILGDKERRKKMGDAAKRLRHADAHRKLADMMEELAG